MIKSLLRRLSSKLNLQNMMKKVNSDKNIHEQLKFQKYMFQKKQKNTCVKNIKFFSK